MSERQIDIKVEQDIVLARQAVRDLARQLGFGTADQTRLATAVSELTRNVINYAEEGVCTILDQSSQSHGTIHVEVEDHGPGIQDIARAMTDGYTSGKGMGAGLPGTRRLVDQFDIQSRAGHTKVTIAMTRRKR